MLILVRSKLHPCTVCHGMGVSLQYRKILRTKGLSSLPPLSLFARHTLHDGPRARGVARRGAAWRGVARHGVSWLIEDTFQSGGSFIPNCS
jgi:hypothetical protein